MTPAVASSLQLLQPTMAFPLLPIHSTQPSSNHAPDFYADGHCPSLHILRQTLPTDRCPDSRPPAISRQEHLHRPCTLHFHHWRLYVTTSADSPCSPVLSSEEAQYSRYADSYTIKVVAQDDFSDVPIPDAPPQSAHTPNTGVEKAASVESLDARREAAVSRART